MELNFEFKDGMYVVNKITGGIFLITDAQMQNIGQLQVQDIRHGGRHMRPSMNFRPYPLQYNDVLDVFKGLKYRVKSIYYEGDYHNDYFCNVEATDSSGSRNTTARARILLRYFKNFV